MHLRELDANLIVVLDALLIDASVTKAAERLSRSPSAVSHALANLRVIFDDDLFVRAGQRLAPTPKVKELAPTVHVIVAGMESLLRPAAPFDPAIFERTFIFSCPAIYEITLLQDLRKILRDAAPDIAVHWKAVQEEQSLEVLRQGNTHFLICEEKDAQAADFCWQHLFNDGLTSLAGPHHPFQSCEPSLEEFAEADHVVISTAYGADDPSQKPYIAAGVQRNETVSTPSVFAAVFLALDSNAVVTVPESAARAISGLTSLRPVKQPFEPIKIPIHLGWHRSFDRDECHQWLRKQIGEITAA